MRHSTTTRAALVLAVLAATLAWVSAAVAGPVRTFHAEVRYAYCSGEAPGLGQVFAGLWHGIPDGSPRYENVYVQIGDADGIVLWNGFVESTAPEPALWSNTGVGASLELVEQAEVPDLGVAELAVDYTLGDPVTSREVGDGRRTSSNQVVTNVTRELTSSVATLIIDGGLVIDLTCSGQDVVQDIISSTPAVWVYNSLGYSVQSCTAINAEAFGLTELSGEVLVSFVSDYLDQPGVIAVSPVFRIASGRWDGQVQLSGLDGPLGYALASATFVVAGPRQTQSFSSPGYRAELAWTPYLLTAHLEGLGAPVDATCEVLRITSWTRFPN